MSYLLRDGRFTDEHASANFITIDQLQQLKSGTHLALDLPNDADLSEIADRLAELAVIRIAFPSFADGRGFSLARRLRQIGYAGTLRAKGHLIPDQYPHAVRAGFDEIELDEDVAARQQESHWRDTLAAVSVSYQDRLRRPAIHPRSQ